MSSRRRAEDGCPMCGGLTTPWGCRPVPLGDYCTVYGLREDISRQPPAPDRHHPEDRDPAVRAARAALASAERDLDAATATWESAALAGLQARSKRYGAPMVSVGGVLVDVVPPGSRHEDLKRLREAEEEADGDRRRAGDRVIVARQALEEARARARKRVTLR